MAKKGLIHVYTGDGKGKTTAAIGLAIRAAGQGERVLFVQFFKMDSASSGEKNIFNALKATGYSIELVRSNCRHPMFTKGKTDEGKVREAISETFRLARKMAEEGGFDLIVLDEVFSAIAGGWVGIEDLKGLLASREGSIEVALTGRSAPSEIVSIADYATEMLKIKHPYDKDISARKGIEY
jgi:cob(I)alamin adenosyltransferase